MPRILVLSHRAVIVDAVLRVARQEGYDVACDASGLEAGATIVVDAGSSERLSDGIELLGRIAESGGRHRVVCIHDGAIPLPLVDHLALLDAPRFDVSELTDDVIRGFLTDRRRIGRYPERRTFCCEELSIASYDERLFEVVEQVRRVAQHDVTLLIVGETGTGKSTLARLIHECSPRREFPFQTVACGALPPEIIESELFGHVRGAFTGADRRRAGRFAAAGRGTLLLDEIDVLGNKQQAMLLRVIETGEYEEVGSTETQHSEARLIVASNVDLETLTKAQKFREDLYYRLNVLEVRLPPLRERRIDVIPLAMQFVRQTCAERGIEIDRIDVRLLDRLLDYPWPGNLRELKNHVQRAVLFSDDGLLSIDALSPKVANWDAAEAVEEDTLAAKVASTERALLEEALRKHGYKRTATAKSLGISRVGLYKKMKRLGMLEASNAR